MDGEGKGVHKKKLSVISVMDRGNRLGGRLVQGHSGVHDVQSAIRRNEQSDRLCIVQSARAARQRGGRPLTTLPPLTHALRDSIWCCSGVPGGVPTCLLRAGECVGVQGCAARLLPALLPQMHLLSAHGPDQRHARGRAERHVRLSTDGAVPPSCDG